MASTAVRGPADLINEHLRGSRWDEVVALYERGLNREERRDPRVQLGYAIALIGAGRIGSGLKLLTREIVSLPQARVDLRRFVLPRFVESGMLDRAASVLSLIVDGHPDSVDDRRLLASILGRLRRTDDSITHARRV